jgi:acyl-CoA synthetase (AMP-forming)/AMP-acid ligase II
MMSHAPQTILDILEQRSSREPDRLAYLFLVDGHKADARLTYSELDRRVRSIAGCLHSRVSPGERALLLYPPGLSFVTAFLGCLHAGVIAVPAPLPESGRLRRTLPRLRSIVADCAPVAVLSTESFLRDLDEARDDAAFISGACWLATDGPDESPASVGRVADPGQTAYLQYTSGSTSSPKGVVVSHRNVLSNCEQLHTAWGHDADSAVATWMPHFHDYGLVDGILVPLFAGIPSYLMSPLAFVKRPHRWLEAISRYGATYSHAPNFGYQLCVDRITEEQRAGLDLSRWRTAGCGAEPIRRETLERFVTAFPLAVSGARRSALPMVWPRPRSGCRGRRARRRGAQPSSLPRGLPGTASLRAIRRASGWPWSWGAALAWNG